MHGSAGVADAGSDGAGAPRTGRERASDATAAPHLNYRQLPARRDCSACHPRERRRRRVGRLRVPHARRRSPRRGHRPLRLTSRTRPPASRSRTRPAGSTSTRKPQQERGRKSRSLQLAEASPWSGKADGHDRRAARDGGALETAARWNTTPRATRGPGTGQPPPPGSKGRRRARKGPHGSGRRRERPRRRPGTSRPVGPRNRERDVPATSDSGPQPAPPAGECPAAGAGYHRERD